MEQHFLANEEAVYTVFNLTAILICYCTQVTNLLKSSINDRAEKQASLNEGLNKTLDDWYR